MSTALTEWQTCSQVCLLDHARAREQLHPRLHERSAETTEARLTIYLNAYRQRLIQAIPEAFGKVHAPVGDTSFVTLADGTTVGALI